MHAHENLPLVEKFPIGEFSYRPQKGSRAGNLGLAGARWHISDSTFQIAHSR